jgi:hypothetical protein
MKIQKTDKKFNLEKFEVAKLKTMQKIIGGLAGDENITTDDNTITDRIKDMASSGWC